ncbi:MAG: isochorismate synthase [Chloroflexota bacterium]
MTTLDLLRPPAPRLAAYSLGSAVREGRQRALTRGEAVLVSVSERVAPCDPLALFSAMDQLPDRVFWEHRDREGGHRLSVAGLGVAYTLPSSSDHDFAEAAVGWRALIAGAVVEAPAARWGLGPLLLGGFSFDPQADHTALWAGFPDADMVLPILILAIVDDEYWLTTSIVVRPEDDPNLLLDTAVRLRDQALTAAKATVLNGVDAGEPFTLQDAMPEVEWKKLVGEVAREVRHGTITKVVLARQVTIDLPDRAFNPGVALNRLRHTFPDAFLFAVSRPNGGSGGPSRVFLGASPERLVRLRGGRLAASCLAGSMGRGADPAADDVLGARLLASPKDRTEHAVVAKMLAESLAPLCENLEIPDHPRLLRLSNVQHLSTPIAGTLKVRSDGTRPCILDLAARLHPTPAVGGYPRPDALALIRRREQLDRGWYAGPIGWLDRQGEGEFAVAIRSALLDGREAHLFAGCGIVGNSDPESEYRESCLKLKAMLGALTGSD